MALPGGIKEPLQQKEDQKEKQIFELRKKTVQRFLQSFLFIEIKNKTTDKSGAVEDE